MIEKPSSVFVTYLVTTPEKLWEALTNREAAEQYFFGRRMQSDWKVGSPFKLVMEDGRIDSQGKVLECDPARRLAVQAGGSEAAFVAPHRCREWSPCPTWRY